MKRFLFILLTLLVLFSFITVTCHECDYIQTLQENKEREKVHAVVIEWIKPIQYIHYNTIPEVEAEMDRLTAYYEELELKLNQTYGQDDEKYTYALDFLVDEFDKILNLLTRYELRIGDIYSEQVVTFWQERHEKYPEATKVWIYMKEHFNWTDEVCAGVMGNIMAEIGGGTLDFSDWNSDDGPYGMFQWLGSREVELKNKYGNMPSIEQQMEFMYDELYGTDGVTQQVRDWQREKFLSSTTPQDAAIRFCQWFERPGGTGSVRKGYAATAYEVFVFKDA